MPAHDAERAEARRKGGHNRSTAARLQKRTPPALRDVLARLEGAVAATLDGTLPPARAVAAAALARALIAVWESSTQEERLRRLEEAAGVGQEAWHG